MAYYLNYIICENFVDGKIKGAGHASIGITEHNPPNKPVLIARMGYVRPGQFIGEEFFSQYSPKKYRFKHKSYPISHEELTELFLMINQTRNQDEVDIQIKHQLKEIEKIINIHCKNNNINIKKYFKQIKLIKKLFTTINYYRNQGFNDRAIKKSLLKNLKNINKSNIEKKFDKFIKQSNKEIINWRSNKKNKNILFEKNQFPTKKDIDEQKKKGAKTNFYGKSYPKGGVEFGWVTMNCKVFALKIMHKIGIIDKFLNRYPRMIPFIAKGMEVMKIKSEEKNKYAEATWQSKMTVSKRPFADRKKFTDEEIDSLIEIEREKILLNTMKEISKSMQETINHDKNKYNTKELKDFKDAIDKNLDKYKKQITNYNKKLKDIKVKENKQLDKYERLTVKLIKNKNFDEKEKNKIKKLYKSKIKDIKNEANKDRKKLIRNNYENTKKCRDNIRKSLKLFKKSDTYKNRTLKNIIIETIKNVLSFFGIKVKKGYRGRINDLNKKINTSKLQRIKIKRKLFR